MMKAIIKGKRIILSGSEVSPGNPRFAQIPSSRYYRRGNPFFSYAASPIVASRIKGIADSCGFTLNCDDDFQWLLNTYDEICTRKYWKTDMAEAYSKDAITKYNPFKTVTRPWAHQYSASHFIRDLPAAYLAMDMGTGKTLVIIDEILKMRPTFTLIVCPKTVIDVWEDEFKIHAPNNDFNIVLLNKGSSSAKAMYLEGQIHLAKARDQPLICIVNYESIYRGGLGKLILSGRWKYVVLDEAHKIKSAGGKASRFCAKITAEYKRCLSGTPLPNNKLDGYGQYRFLEPGIFGTSFGRYKNRFAEMGGYGGYEIVGWRNEDEFNRLLDIIMFRVDQSVLNLPADTTTWRSVDVSPEGRLLLSKLEKEFIVWLDSGEAVTANNALAKLMRMRQITSGFAIDEHGKAHHVHDGRKNAMKELLMDIGTNDGPVVVFAEFIHDLEAIAEVCRDLQRSYGFVRGGRNDLVGAKIPPGMQTVICHPKSGSLGLNMTAAHYCVFYSTGFNLAEHLQAKKRVLRGGQTLETRFFHLVAANTIDVQMYKALKMKESVVEKIMTFVKNGGKF